MKNPFQAINPGRRPDRATKRRMTRADQRAVRRLGAEMAVGNYEPRYPVVPAGWPNRAARRRSPQSWQAFLKANPEVRSALRLH
jgi:hypothetical protein